LLFKKFLRPSIDIGRGQGFEKVRFSGLSRCEVTTSWDVDRLFCPRRTFPRFSRRRHVAKIGDFGDVKSSLKKFEIQWSTSLKKFEIQWTSSSAFLSVSLSIFLGETLL
jgi:hypothetical protein